MRAIVSENLSGSETALVHKFELAGLGKAPFRYVGMSESYIVHPDGTTQASGTCDYCGTGIRYVFHCESADKNRFKVGCDCIHKIGDKSLVKLISADERKLRDAKNARAKERKAERAAARFAAAMEKLPAVRGTLASLPHPNSYFASTGRTLLDYVDWCIANRATEKAAVVIESV